MLPAAKLAGGLSQQLCQTASHFLSLRFAGSIGLTAASGGNPVIQNDSKGLVVVSVKASGGMKGGMTWSLRGRFLRNHVRYVNMIGYGLACNEFILGCLKSEIYK